MKLFMLVMDNFLENPYELRNWAISKGFKDEKSPVDGLAYEGVCKDIPWIFTAEAELKLSTALQAVIETKLSFVRLSTHNLAKRWIHVDPMYADFILVLYLNERYENGAGTRLFEHPKIDLFREDLGKKQIKAWDKDCNDETRWNRVGEIHAKWNRAAIYPTRIFHAPLPKDGFGQNSIDGRMVMASFFNIRR